MTTIIAPLASNMMMGMPSATTTTVVPPVTEKRFLFFKRGEQQRRRKTSHSSSPKTTTALLCEALASITGGSHLASSLKSKCNSKSKSNNSNNNNNVHFAPHVNVQFIPSIEDMTDEEKCNTWMQIAEHNAIRRSCLQLIESVVEKAAGENIDDSDNDDGNGNNDENGNGNDQTKKIVAQDLLCTRGLESHFPQPHQNGHQTNRRKAIQHVVAAVSSSSSTQENDTNTEVGVSYCTHGYYDDQAIADLYQGTGKTQEFQLTAELMAIQDRQDVELYLLE